MKVCIYGAGAIGGYLGVQLAQAGADVSRAGVIESAKASGANERAAMAKAYQVRIRNGPPLANRSSASPAGRRRMSGY